MRPGHVWLVLLLVGCSGAVERSQGVAFAGSAGAAGHGGLNSGGAGAGGAAGCKVADDCPDCSLSSNGVISCDLPACVNGQCVTSRFPPDVDGGAAGAAGSAGQPSGGAAGAGGGGADCAALRIQLDQALSEAQQCSNQPGQCQTVVSSDCGCALPDANGPNSYTTFYYQSSIEQWRSAGCSISCPPCAAPTHASCHTMDGGVGRCMWD